MKQKLFNPFIQLAGGWSLLMGMGIMGLTALVAGFSGIHFDGVIDVHKFSGSRATAQWLFVVEPLLAWAFSVAVFFLAGLLFSRSAIRLIDVAGTMAIARGPMFFAALLGFTYTVQPLSHNIKDMMGAIIAGLATLPFTIWMIALMYNAFIVSCNVKEKKAPVFVISLIVAELLAFCACHFLYSHI